MSISGPEQIKRKSSSSSKYSFKSKIVNFEFLDQVQSDRIFPLYNRKTELDRQIRYIFDLVQMLNKNFTRFHLEFLDEIFVKSVLLV